MYAVSTEKAIQDSLCSHRIVVVHHELCSTFSYLLRHCLKDVQPQLIDVQLSHVMFATNDTEEEVCALGALTPQLKLDL